MFNTITVAKVLDIVEIGKNVTELVKNIIECMEQIRKMKPVQNPRTIIQEQTDADHKVRICSSIVKVDCQKVGIQMSRQWKTEPNQLTILLSDNLWREKVFDNFPLDCTDVKILKFGKAKERAWILQELMCGQNMDSVTIISYEEQGHNCCLNFDILNLIPGNDDRCFRMEFAADRDRGFEVQSVLFVNMVREITMELIGAYKRYRKPVYMDMNRITLEAKILDTMGYRPVEFEKMESGYGLRISLGTDNESVLIILRNDYPKSKPEVVIKNFDVYVQVIIDTEWNNNYTVGHIVKALEERME